MNVYSFFTNPQPMPPIHIFVFTPQPMPVTPIFLSVLLPIYSQCPPPMFFYSPQPPHNIIVFTHIYPPGVASPFMHLVGFWPSQLNWQSPALQWHTVLFIESYHVIHCNPAMWEGKVKVRGCNIKQIQYTRPLSRRDLREGGHMWGGNFESSYSAFLFYLIYYTST